MLTLQNSKRLVTFPLQAYNILSLFHKKNKVIGNPLMEFHINVLPFEHRSQHLSWDRFSLAMALLKNAVEKLIQVTCPSPAHAEKGSGLRTNSSLHPRVNSGIWGSVWFSSLAGYWLVHWILCPSRMKDFFLIFSLLWYNVAQCLPQNS